MKMRLLVSALLLAVVGALAWGAMRMVRAASVSSATEVPTTHIKKGSVTIFVAARGELQGGNSEMLTAPMVGGQDMSITDLRAPGELVNEGDVVVQFDTTQQEFNLREAEADLAEAEQQVIQAESTALAAEEEARYQVIATAADVKLAELEVRRNPVLATIKGRQNEIALEAAQNRAKQAVQDAQNKKATSLASVAIQKASQNKATVMAAAAKRMIDSMTLKAKTSGYVNIQQNQGQNMYWGMALPPFQIGDTTRAGMAVAQIPDLKNWEVSANVGELDRGHLTAGQKVSVAVVALAGKQFAGRVKSMGGTSGPPWDRNFECRITLDEAGAGAAARDDVQHADHDRHLERRAVGAFAGAVREGRPQLRIRADAAGLRAARREAGAAQREPGGDERRQGRRPGGAVESRPAEQTGCRSGGRAR